MLGRAAGNSGDPVACGGDTSCDPESGFCGPRGRKTGPAVPRLRLARASAVSLSRRVVCVPDSQQLRRSSSIRDGGAGFSRPADTVCAPAVFLRVRFRRSASLTLKQVSVRRIDVIKQCPDVPRKTRNALSWLPVHGVSSFRDGMGGRADGCVGLAGTSGTPSCRLADGEMRPRADGNVASVHHPVRENGGLAAWLENPRPSDAYSVPRTPSSPPENGVWKTSNAY